MLTSERFEVEITGTHGVRLPPEFALPFAEAGHKRLKLKAYFLDNSIDFHGALHKYEGYFVISFGKRYQKELGVSKEDKFELQLFEDQSKYGVEMPEEFAAVLESDPEATQGFEKMTDGKKRSLIYYITRFKSSQKRIDKALIIADNIKLGVSDPKEMIKDRR